jgi:hypothetical protein
VTRRWSKADSNSESHPRATPPAATRFVADSALEQSGFELSVPRAVEEMPERYAALSGDGAMVGVGPPSVSAPFTVGPGVRIPFAPAKSHVRTGLATAHGEQVGSSEFGPGQPSPL